MRCAETMTRGLWLAALVALAACGDRDPVSAPADEPASAARWTSDVIGHDWRLEAFVRADSTLTPVVDGTVVTLSLRADGTVDGVGGCNTYGGQWSTDDDGRLRIDELYWTEMACSEPPGVLEQEQRFLEAVGQVTAARRSGDILRVDYGREGAHLRLSLIVREQAPPGPLPGIDWQLELFQSRLGDPAETAEVIDGSRVTATFLEDGTVRGSTGCNDWGARWSTTGDSLTIEVLAATEKACQEPAGVMAQERRFLEALSQVRAYTSTSDRLWLHATNQTLEFVPAPDTVIVTWRDSLVLGDGRALAYAVDGCTNFFAPPQNRVTGTGDGVVFDYVLDTYCTVNRDGRIHMDGTVAADRIVLMATFRGPIVRCRCLIPVRGRLDGLAPGTYTVTLQQTFEFDGEPQPLERIDERRVIVGIDSTNAALEIRGGTSFGECRGYCWNELRLDGDTAVLVAGGWDAASHPEQRVRMALDATTWSRLRTAHDVQLVYELDERIGCPDCADGGAEWIEVTTAAGTRRVTYEFGNPPPEVAELAATLERLRRHLLGELDERTVVEE